MDLGAFRTFPKGNVRDRRKGFRRNKLGDRCYCVLPGYKPPDEIPSEYQTIPLNKIEDFGVHCKQYYSLDVSYFKSSLDTKVIDALWNTYWVNTLASNPLVTNASYVNSQIYDLGAKLEQVST